MSFIKVGFFPNVVSHNYVITGNRPVCVQAFNTLPSPSKDVLKDEIDSLRHRMERAVDDGHPFTSSLVIELSEQLDRKIVEYMRTKS